jgi:hypothetical protein
VVFFDKDKIEIKGTSSKLEECLPLMRKKILEIKHNIVHELIKDPQMYISLQKMLNSNETDFKNKYKVEWKHIGDVYA